MMYRYLGPLSSVTLNGIQSQGDGPPNLVSSSFILFPKAELQLPAGHSYVETLLAGGWLIPVEMPRLKVAAKPAAKFAEPAAKPAEAAQ